jgi:hypothetical protein
MSWRWPSMTASDTSGRREMFFAFCVGARVEMASVEPSKFEVVGDEGHLGCAGLALGGEDGGAMAAQVLGERWMDVGHAIVLPKAKGLAFASVALQGAAGTGPHSILPTL